MVETWAKEVGLLKNGYPEDREWQSCTHSCIPFDRVTHKNVRYCSLCLSLLFCLFCLRSIRPQDIRLGSWVRSSKVGTLHGHKVPAWSWASHPRSRLRHVVASLCIADMLCDVKTQSPIRKNIKMYADCWFLQAVCCRNDTRVFVSLIYILNWWRPCSTFVWRPLFLTRSSMISLSFRVGLTRAHPSYYFLRWPQCDEKSRV